jgi:uncharacterized protein YbjT (DUF2867 family)
LQGDLYDHENLVKVIKQVDVVISTVGHVQLPDQVKIIAAIKEAGNIKVVSLSVSFSTIVGTIFDNFSALLSIFIFIFYILI